MELTRYSTDEVLETEGVWEDMGSGCRFLIARSGNPNFEAARKKYGRSVLRQIENDDLEEARETTILCEMIAKTVWLAFEGLTEDGKKVKDSYENRLRILTDYKDLRSEILEIARTRQRFHIETQKEDAKN